jgi:hypothetical protein
MKLLVDSAARLTRLQSNNAASSQTKYNYLFHEDTGQVRCLKLVSALVPRSFYAVVPGWSQNFEYLEGATERSVSLSLGTYDGATLATELSAALNSATAGFTCTYDDKTNKLTFVNGSGGNITIPNQIVGITTGTYPDPGVNTILGLDGNGSGTIANGTQYEAPGMVNMSAPAYLFLSVTSGSVNNSNGIRDWYTRRQFMISFGETPFLGIKEQPINSQFCQGERIDNQAFRNVLVEWRTGIADVETFVSDIGAESLVKAYPLDFNGVDHQLLFEASS